MSQFVCDFLVSLIFSALPVLFLCSCVGSGSIEGAAILWLVVSLFQTLAIMFKRGGSWGGMEDRQ